MISKVAYEVRIEKPLLAVLLLAVDKIFPWMWGKYCIKWGVVSERAVPADESH